MPTYEYACKSCGEHLEVAQGFRDDPLTTCPACGGPLRKVFGAIGIAFKGSGFYRTDSRDANGGAKRDAKAGAKSGEAKTGGDAPAAAKGDSPSSSGSSSSSSDSSSSSKAAASK